MNKSGHGERAHGEDARTASTNRPSGESTASPAPLDESARSRAVSSTGPSGNASRDRQLGELADRIVRVARRIEAHRFQDPLITPVSPLEALFLRYVDDHPGTSPGAMARDLMVRSSNASAGLRSLEGKGLITRGTDPDDARVTRLFVTDDARRATARVRMEWAHLLDGLLPPTANVAEALHVLELLDDAPGERDS